MAKAEKAEAVTDFLRMAEIERWPIDRVRPDPKNARTHSEAQVAEIVASMREWGWTIPLLVDDEGLVLAGHGRLMAARSLKIAEVPVIVARGWTDVQKRAYGLADNKLALNAGWDVDQLKVTLAGLSDMGVDLSLVGFNKDELGALFGDHQGKQGLVDPDAVPAVAKVAATAPGDIWLCGSHRVGCGDATVLADLEAVVGEREGQQFGADACWTDPPYNVNYEGKAGKIKNDSMGDADFRQFLVDAMSSIYAVVRPGGAVYVAHADTEGLNFRSAFIEAGFKLSGCLIWTKNSLVLGRSDYQWQHEPILYGWKPGAAHSWYGGRKQTTLQQFGGSIFSVNPDGTVTVRVGAEAIVISGDNLTAQSVEGSLVPVEKPAKNGDHPTMKPVELIARGLRNSTKQGDVVVDPFGGSGSTLIACEMLGRQARLLELDPLYVDVIVRRWEQFSGGRAVHAVTGAPFPASGGVVEAA